MLEELGARFELVVEAVSGFGGSDALSEEIFGQFAEVGRQIRFLSDRSARTATQSRRAPIWAPKWSASARLWAVRGSILGSN